MPEDSQDDTEDKTQFSRGTVYTNTPYTCTNGVVTFPKGHGTEYDKATLLLNTENMTIEGFSCHYKDKPDHYTPEPAGLWEERSSDPKPDGSRWSQIIRTTMPDLTRDPQFYQPGVTITGNATQRVVSDRLLVGPAADKLNSQSLINNKQVMDGFSRCK
jgi:hypothetical protein